MPNYIFKILDGPTRQRLEELHTGVPGEYEADLGFVLEAGEGGIPLGRIKFDPKGIRPYRELDKAEITEENLHRGDRFYRIDAFSVRFNQPIIVNYVVGKGGNCILMGVAKK